MLNENVKYTSLLKSYMIGLIEHYYVSIWILFVVYTRHVTPPVLWNIIWKWHTLLPFLYIDIFNSPEVFLLFCFILIHLRWNICFKIVDSFLLIIYHNCFSFTFDYNVHIGRVTSFLKSLWSLKSIFVTYKSLCF